VALAAASRFVIDLRLGPRTLQTAADLVASVALACVGGHLPLFLIDNHLPYPAAILQVFGLVKHGRRRRRRGRKKKRRLKPPPGLLVGVVEKVRDAAGNLLGVRTRALFGRLKDIRRRIRELGIGHEINTAYVERLNGTLRGQQARLARRTRNGSRLADMLRWALGLWRDLYNWTRRHAALDGQAPAMALRLAEEVWSVRRYVAYPVHVSDHERQAWADARHGVLESALDVYESEHALPIS
jgi:hypothetical protein